MAKAQKTGGQQEIVEDLLPELKDEEVAGKVGRIFELRTAAKEHDKLLGEVKDILKGFVLGLSKEDQAIGRVRIGEYILPFTITVTSETPVSFKRKAGKKVNLKFAPEEDDE